MNTVGCVNSTEAYKIYEKCEQNRFNYFQRYGHIYNCDLFMCSIDSSCIFDDWISNSRKLDCTNNYTVNCFFFWISYRPTIFNVIMFLFSGFYCTAIIKLLSSLFYSSVINFSVIFNIGTCLYVEAMLNDLKTTIKKFDSSNRESNRRSRSQKSQSWIFHVDAINLHNDIIK